MEMNIHSISSITGQTEMKFLSSIEGNFMNPQSSSSNMKIVQDSLLAMYLMTDDNVIIPDDLWATIIMYADNWTPDYIAKKTKHYYKVLDEMGITEKRITGKMVFSFMLPDDFNYNNKVKIYKGVLLEGRITKTQLNGGQNSIIHNLYKEYCVETSLTFINNVQFCTTHYLNERGFTVGIFDCLDYKKSEIDEVVYKGFLQSEDIDKNIHNEYIKEAKINDILGKTKDISMNIVRDHINSNNFISTITSGSKGSMFNISQITSLLGQQNIDGERIQPQLYNNRTMCHYDFGTLDIDTKYESKGFIKHSFIRGLEPEELFFHAITGRNGVIDKLVSITGRVKSLLLPSQIFNRIWQHIL